MVNNPRASFCLLSLLLTILALLPYPSPSLAQLAPEPIYSTYINVMNVSWSADSTTFVFQEGLEDNTPTRGIGVHTDKMNWFAYHPHTSEITRSDSWPLQPPVSPAQKQRIHLATIEAQESFIFPSPNGRFWAYLAKPPTDWCYGTTVCGYPLAVYDQVTGKFQYITYIKAEPPINYYHQEDIEYIPSGGLWNFEYDYDLKWSADSSTLFGLIITTGNANLTFRIAGFDTSPLALTVDMFSDAYYAKNQTLLIMLYEISAISSNGKRFLTESHLFWLYDIDDFSKARNISTLDGVIAASFDPQDDNIIWYISSRGLFRRDLTTDQEILIDTLINSTPATNNDAIFGNAWFAPDLSYIALLEDDNGASFGGLQTLYMYNLAERMKNLP